MRVLSSRWVKIVVSIGLIFFLLRSTSFQVFLQHVSTTRLEWWLLAFIGYLVSQVISGYKWRILARPLGFDPPLLTFIAYYYVGMYLNLFVPSTVAGDVGRGLLLAPHGKGLARALQSVVADRISGFVMLLWVSASGFLLFGPTVLPSLLCYSVIGTSLLLVASWWALPPLLAWLFAPDSKIRTTLEKTLLPYRRHSGVVVKACYISFLFHLFQLSLQVLLTFALGLTVPFWYLMICIPLIHILSGLPLSFAGIGAREGGYAAFLTMIGLSREEAVAFGLLWSAIGVGAGLVGGLVFLCSADVRTAIQRARTTPSKNGEPREGIALNDHPGG